MAEVVTNAEGQRGWYEPIWGTWHDEYVPARLEDGSINPDASDEDQSWERHLDEQKARDDAAQLMTVEQRQQLVPVFYEYKAPVIAPNPVIQSTGVIGGQTLQQLQPQPVPPASPAPTILAPVTVTSPAPTNSNPVMNANGHTYLTSGASYDEYFLIDEGGDRIQWRVPKGGDSRDVIPGSIVNMGQSAGTTAPVGNNAPATPAPSIAPIIADPQHKYIGQAGNGNQIFQLTDRDGNIVQWQVVPGDNSATVVEGSMFYVYTNPNPPAQTVVANPVVNTPTPVNTPTTVNNNVVNTNSTNPNNVRTNVHVYAGRDAQGNDVYQLVDAGGNLVEWSVAHGADSRASIPSTVHYVTAGDRSRVAAIPGNDLPPGNSAVNAPANPFSNLAIGDLVPKLLGAALVAYLTK